MWYKHVCTEQKHVHTRNAYITLISHAHTLGYFMHDSDPLKILLNPCTSFLHVLIQVYECVCDFHDFICFLVFSNRCMYWKRILFLCLFFWLSQLLHQLCHWARRKHQEPENAAVLLWMIGDVINRIKRISWYQTASCKSAISNWPQAFCRNCFIILWSMIFNDNLLVPGCNHVYYWCSGVGRGRHGTSIYLHALWKLSTCHKPSMIHLIVNLDSKWTSTR